MAFVDRSIQNDFTSLAPGEFPNLTGLSVTIQSEPSLSAVFESIQSNDDTVRFFFSVGLSGPQIADLDQIVADHLATDDESDPDASPIENVSTINGVDFDIFSSSTTSHVASTANPHNTTLLNLPNFSLVELNAKLTGADVDDTSNPRTPSPHTSTHSQGGSDEIQIQDLGSGAAPAGQIAQTDGSGGLTLINVPSVVTDHGNLNGLGDDDHPQYVLEDGSRPFSGDVDLGSNDVTNVGLVDGVDISTQATNTNAHIANQSNPHLTSVANLVPGTIAQLNGKITDANLDDSGDPRDPNAHASTHIQGGSDEIVAQDLSSGVAPSGQLLETDGVGGFTLTSMAGVMDHGNLTGLGDDDHPQYTLEDGSRPFSGDIDLGGNSVTNVNLVDGVDVSAQATATNDHIADQGNPHNTSIANIGQGTLVQLNAAISDATLDDVSDPRDPNTHSSTHAAGGSDPLSHSVLADLTTGDPHTQYTTEARARAAAPVRPTTGIPSNALGQDGDLAIDADDTSLYEKDAGTWTLVDTLKGDKGDIGFGIGAFARTSSTGAIIEGLGLTVFRVSLGRYRYDFTTPLPDANYSVVGQVYDTTTDTNIEFSSSELTSAGFFLNIGQGDNGTANDTNVDRAHAVVVFGLSIQGPSGISSAYESWLAIGNVGTESDFIADLVGPVGPGVPTGGALGEVLVKQSATDFDTAFQALTAADVGADPIGSAASAIADHVNQVLNPDPHPQYTTQAEAAAAAPIQSVNGDTGPSVSLDTGDVPEGLNLYYTEVRVSANADVAANTAHRNITGNPHSTTPADIGAIALSEKGAINGVATLDASGKIPTAQIPASALPEFDVVADIPARDALTSQEGDEAFVQSNNKFYIFDGSVWVERTPNPDTVLGPALSTDGAIPLFSGTNGRLLDNSTLTVDGSGNLSVGGNDVTNVGTVDGVDVSTQAATTNAHINSTANPHATSLANLGSGTLADLNSVVSDATIDDVTGTRDPNAHAATHAAGGADELEVQSLSSGAATAGQIFQADGSGGVVVANAPSIVTDHGALTGLGDDDHPQYLLVDGSRPMTGELNLGSNNIGNVGFVDGVDVSAQKLSTDSHIASTANPHSTSLSNLVAGTLADLNAAVSDATLDDASSPRTPTVHALSHQQGGADELEVQSLGSGSAAAGQIFQADGIGGISVVNAPAVITDHGALSGLGDDDHPQYLLVDGTRVLAGDLDVGGNNVVNVGTVDGIDVSAQASTTNAHITSTGNPHSTSLANLGAGTLAQLNALVSDATLDDSANPRTPTAHAPTHISGGSDVIDGDRVDISYVPTTYERDNSIPETVGIAELAAHLAGINARLVFGQNLVEVEDLPDSVTTAENVFETKLTLNVSVNTLNAGRYKIEWSYFWSHDATTNDFVARIRQDGTTDIMTHRQEPKDSGGTGPGGTNQRQPASGFIFVNLGTGSFQFDLEFATENGGVESTMGDARMMIYRIS